MSQDLLEDFTTTFPAVVKEASDAFRSGDPIQIQSAVSSLHQSFQDRYLEGTPEVRDGAIYATVNLVLAGSVRVWQDLVVWKFQNCTSSNIRIQTKYFHAGQGFYFWGSCHTVQPGRVLEAWPGSGIPTASYRYC